MGEGIFIGTPLCFPARVKLGTSAKRDSGQNALASLYSIAQLYCDFRRLRKDYVCTGTKLDQPYALSTRQFFTRLVIEYNASRQQPGNLLEDHGHPIAFQGNNVLLIVVGGSRSHGVAKLAFLVNCAFDHTSNG